MRNTLWIGFVFFSCTEYHKYLYSAQVLFVHICIFGVRCYNLFKKALSLQPTTPTRLYLEFKIT